MTTDTPLSSLPSESPSDMAVGPEWQIWPGLSPYAEAVSRMTELHSAVHTASMAEQVILLEHPAIYTEGTSAKSEDLLGMDGVEVIRNTGRGGQWTYHGPGIRIVWPVLNLNRRARDVRLYVHHLEGWVIDTLSCFGIFGLRREGLPGIWVSRSDIGQPNRLDKIAAIGVRLQRWVSMHGMAINIDPDLSHFTGIVPCGVTDGGVTSLAELGLTVTQAELDMALQSCFEAHFGPHSPMAETS